MSKRRSKRIKPRNNNILYIRRDSQLYIQVPLDMLTIVNQGDVITLTTRAYIVGTVTDVRAKGLILADWRISRGTEQ